MNDTTSLMDYLRERPGLLALAIVLAVAALYLPWLGLNDLVHEETRRAVIARNMMDSGDYLVPHLAERIYLNKPPLFNWAIVAVSAPFERITEFSARLPSVISLALLALFMAFVPGRRLLTPGRWLLGLGVIVTGELMHKAVLAEIDVLFTLFVSLCLWVWFELDERGRHGLALWLPPALLLAIAFLTKREPALVFYYLAIGGYLLQQRRLGELFRPPHLFSAAVTLAIIGGWLSIVVNRVGVEALIENFSQEVLARGITTSTADYLRHFVEYPFKLLVAALPGSLLLLPLAWRSVRRAVLARYGRMFVFAAIAVAINLPIYWLRAGANVRYFLPMFPTLLVMAAMVLDVYAADRAALTRATRWAIAGIGLLLLALTTVIAAAGLVLSIPGLFPQVAGPLIPAPLMAGLCLATLAGAVWLLLRRRSSALMVFAATLGFGLLFRLATLGFVVPHEARKLAEREHMPQILERIRSELPAGVDHVQGLGWIPHAVWFYDREDTVIPEARYERSGKLASRYVLVRVYNEDMLAQLGGPVTRIDRIFYDDGDFILARVGPSPDSR